MKNQKDQVNDKKRSANYGKYGIIQLSDLFTRKMEFQAWLREVKNMNNEDLNSSNERKFYQEFIKKYNNAELPEKKYYDIVKWNAKELMKLLKKRRRDKEKEQPNTTHPVVSEEVEFVFDDEGQKEKEKKILKEIEQKKKFDEVLYSMNKEKADEMKEVEFKGNLMRHYYQTGDLVAAKDIHKQYFSCKKEKETNENGAAGEVPEEND